MKREARLVADLVSATVVLVVLIALVVAVLPGYLERNEPEPEPEPINTGITKVTDYERGIVNLPCHFTAEGC